MGTVALPISGLVNVQVSLAPAASQAQNTTSLLLLTNNAIIDLHTRMMSFGSLEDVGVTFGTDSIEYAAAALWFGQQPSPTELLVGKWALTPTAGKVSGAPLTAAQQDMTLWTAIVAGNFDIEANGFPPLKVDALDFSTQTNLNGVASVINTAMTTVGAQALCVWDGFKFVFTSKTTGATSDILPIGPNGDIADISTMLKCDVVDEPAGAYHVAGSAAETAADAVSLFELNYGYQWYALVMPECTNADHIAVAQSIQGSTATKHFYGITTQEASTMDATSTTDLAYQLAQMALNKTAIQFSRSSPYAVCSFLGRILTTDYSQNSSVITLMYKQEPGVAAEFLNRTQMDAVMKKNCNVFVAYQGGALIIQPGTTTATNQFVDTVVGLDNLAIELQLQLFNLLYSSTTKIPQTDAGMNQLTGAAETILLNYVSAGLLAPGIWTAAGFGTLATGAYVEKGYYVFCPPIAQQSIADRAARMAGPMRIAVKLAGAIHTVDATIDVNP